MSDVKVGDRCVIERRLSWPNGPVDHRRETEVTRLTPKRAYFARSWFALEDPTREVKPKYLDYTSRVVEVKRALPSESKARDE